eukprot:tig00021127_g18687.t1
MEAERLSFASPRPSPSRPFPGPAADSPKTPRLTHAGNNENLASAANRSEAARQGSLTGPGLFRTSSFSAATWSPAGLRRTLSFTAKPRPSVAAVVEGLPARHTRIQSVIRIRGRVGAPAGAGEGCVRATGQTSIEFTRDEAATPRGARAYDFDRVFGPGATQEEVFAAAVAPSLGEYLRGFNAAVLAYGQTGSGKTYTMQGVPGEVGAVQRSLRHIFAARAAAAAAGQEPWAVTLSMLEIYNETLLDLLAKPAAGADGAPSGPRLQIMTDATGQIRIPGLSEVAAESAEEAEAAVMAAVERRQTAATRANEVSSRSHCVLWVRTRFRVAEAVVQPSLYLVDLAGSENADQTGGEARRQQESSKINTSLLTLNKVIELLAERCRAMAAQSAALNASLTSPRRRWRRRRRQGRTSVPHLAAHAAAPAGARRRRGDVPRGVRLGGAGSGAGDAADAGPERGEAPATPQARGEAEAALEARLAELQQRAAQSEDEAGALRAALARARAALQAEREEREAEGPGCAPRPPASPPTSPTPARPAPRLSSRRLFASHEEWTGAESALEARAADLQRRADEAAAAASAQRAALASAEALLHAEREERAAEAARARAEAAELAARLEEAEAACRALETERDASLASLEAEAERAAELAAARTEAEAEACELRAELQEAAACRAALVRSSRALAPARPHSRQGAELAEARAALAEATARAAAAEGAAAERGGELEEARGRRGGCGRSWSGRRGRGPLCRSGGGARSRGARGGAGGGAGGAGGAAADADALRAALAQRDADLAAARRALEEAKGTLARRRLALLEERREEALGTLRAELRELEAPARPEEEAARRQRRRKLQAAMAGLQAAYEACLSYCAIPTLPSGPGGAATPCSPGRALHAQLQPQGTAPPSPAPPPHSQT